MTDSNLPAAPLTAWPALQPDALGSEAAAAVRAILAEAAAANSVRSYAGALRYWAAWYRLRYGHALALPLPVPAVLQFVVDHLRRTDADGRGWELPEPVDAALVAGGFKRQPGPLTLSTLTHRIAVLSSAHRARDVDNPCEAAAVRQLLARARRVAAKRGEQPRKKTAITSTELQAMLATCDDSLEGLRDRALLCFGFASGGRRRGEIAAAQRADLHPIGPDEFVYRLARSKTRQAGVATDTTPDKPVLGPAGAAMAAWLAAAAIDEGPLFRRLWGPRVGPGLSDKSVAAIVQRRARLAGLVGDFGGHSLRSGFITEGGRRGVALPALMALTEHRSVGTVLGYYQAGEVVSSPAARFLERTGGGARRDGT